MGRGRRRRTSLRVWTDGARVAAGDDHLVDARGAQPRVLLEGGADEVGVGIEAARSNEGALVEANGLERSTHGIGVK